MADDPALSARNEILDLLTEFLINAEVTNAYTLDEFRESFPPAERSHNDVKVLYESFQKKRKKLRATVRRNLLTHFSTRKLLQQHGSRLTPQATEDTPAGGEDTKHLEETLKTMHKRLATIEDELTRCAQVFKDKDILQHLQEKHFHI